MSCDDLIVRELRAQGDRIVEAIRLSDAHREDLFLRLVVLLHAELHDKRSVDPIANDVGEDAT